MNFMNTSYPATLTFKSWKKTKSTSDKLLGKKKTGLGDLLKNTEELWKKLPVSTLMPKSNSIALGQVTEDKKNAVAAHKYVKTLSNALSGVAFRADKVLKDSTIKLSKTTQAGVKEIAKAARSLDTEISKYDPDAIFDPIIKDTTKELNKSLAAYSKGAKAVPKLLQLLGAKPDWKTFDTVFKQIRKNLELLYGPATMMKRSGGKDQKDWETAIKALKIVENNLGGLKKKVPDAIVQDPVKSKALLQKIAANNLKACVDILKPIK